MKIDKDNIIYILITFIVYMIIKDIQPEYKWYINMLFAFIGGFLIYYIYDHIINS